MRALPDPWTALERGYGMRDAVTSTLLGVLDAREEDEDLDDDEDEDLEDDEDLDDDEDWDEDEEEDEEE
jgi:hypothetical protein